LQYVSALITVGQHLLDLVNNYLDLAKIEANKQTLELENLAVEDVCQASLFIVSEKAREKQLELSLKLGDSIDFCMADSVRLKQILVNLLSNGVKFTAKGSVTLQVDLKEDTLYFAVIDTGIGISTANLEKLFQPFQQLTNHHEGTGLGLALSRKLAQLHGGDITVTSEIDKGSCFTLHIPRHIA
jgi:signal transduction histidine kinase